MIPVTYRASFSYLLRHPWQLALALLGISVGVAVIVAVDLANASARKAFLLSNGRGDSPDHRRPARRY
jgi:putative ABC transport system permease protein